jgi:CelD/BcsL family acetyltransferase involved in cellulose biosynthesis
MSTTAPLYRVFWLSSVSDLMPWQNALTSFFTGVASQNRFANWTQLLFYFNRLNQTPRLCIITTPGYRIQGLMLLKQNRTLVPTLDAVGNTPHTTDANELLIDADPAHIVPLLAKALVNAPFKWSRLNWQFLQQADHWQLFASALAPYVKSIALAADMPRPVLSLPATEADYLKQRSSRVKKFVNNKQNRLGRDFPDQPLSLRWVAAADTPAIMDWFFPTYLSYWDKQGVKTEFHRHPELVAFYRECLLQGLLKLTGYFVGQDVACVFVGYDLPAHTYLLHLTCFNPKYGDYSPGILHNDAIIKSLIDKGYKTLDFGLGDLEYKSYFTKTKLPTWQLKVHRTLISQCVFGTLDALKSRIKALLKRNTVSVAPDKPDGKSEASAEATTASL